MDPAKLNIGILHSLIGKNDGVSIVIDQTIEAMVEYMRVPLGNIHLLGALAPARFNKTEHEIFWHKNDQNKYILKHFAEDPPKNLDQHIKKHALIAKKLIAAFVEENDIDLLIVHNSCHPTNFIYAVATGMYFEELAKQGRWLPRYFLWWHDSHYERKRFKNPNHVIKKYLEYIPGVHVNGVAFINSVQAGMAQKYFKEKCMLDIKNFFKNKTAIIPNTCDIPWDWKNTPSNKDGQVVPQEDGFNSTFFKDIGLLDRLKKRGYSLKNAVLLLQHTRVVERKRIDIAIEYAIRLEKKFRKEKKNKCVVLLISGHSGDEDDLYLKELRNLYIEKAESDPMIRKNVIVVFAEKWILAEKEIIVDKKYYRFRDIPGIVARYGGLGTYFSEVEGYGNNLLEMVSMGLPVVINRYPIYKTDIEQLGFKLPGIDDCKLNTSVVNQGYELITNPKKRKETALHNLKVLEEKLNHKIIAQQMEPLIRNMFTYR